jgi:micrococcal nuclease
MRSGTAPPSKPELDRSAPGGGSRLTLRIEKQCRLRRLPIFAILLASLLAFPGAAVACDDDALAATVVGIETSETVRLDRPVDGTRTVRIAGIRAPDGAEATLSRLLIGSTVCLSPSETRQDRYGRLLAHVHLDGGLWLQGELLRLGLARVEPTPDARRLAPEMLAIERDARAAGRGRWRSGAFRVYPADDAGAAIGSFHLVEGRVLDAARRQDRWYLNFGPDWRTDFTVVIPKAAFAAFVQAGVEPYALKGRSIRVRGWVDRQNGPMIEVLVPEQIEVIDHDGG